MHLLCISPNSALGGWGVGELNVTFKSSCKKRSPAVGKAVGRPFLAVEPVGGPWRADTEAVGRADHQPVSGRVQLPPFKPFKPFLEVQGSLSGRGLSQGPPTAQIMHTPRTEREGIIRSIGLGLEGTLSHPCLPDGRQGAFCADRARGSTAACGSVCSWPCPACSRETGLTHCTPLVQTRCRRAASLGQMGGVSQHINDKMIAALC